MPPSLPPTAGVFGGLKRALFRHYRESLGRELSALGVRYDDLLDPTQDPDVDAALRRLPPGDIEARNARLRRALNLQMKRETLPEELRRLQTPWAHYALGELYRGRRENREGRELNTPRPYRRSIP